MIKKPRMRPLTYVLRAMAVLVVTVIAAAVFLLGVVFVLTKGPSETAKRLFVLTVKETSAGGFLADIFLTGSEVDEILNGKAASDSEATVDPGLIKIVRKTKPAETEQNGGNAETSAPAQEEKAAEPDVELIDIEGAAYKGKLLIVRDPSRVIVGIPGEYGEGHSGKTVKVLTAEYKAIAGINAGGFYDPNGKGTGGIPEGLVIYEGELKWGDKNKKYSIIGFDSSDVLHVGTMTAAHALELDMKYSVSFGPALVINGEPCNSAGSLGGGVNPRTAIGQREDGAVLLLVINGRQIDSLGATLDELCDVMLQNGAVNASNLDGGSSSIMVYNGEFVTSSAYVFGERVVATSFLVTE